ncbi:MAG TPA: HNH endonuclease [Micromonosporaceae bacterium]|nr:HNH endonuclease [Micromonosporaceae bacterium]
MQSGGWNKHQSDWEPSSCAADDCDKPAHSRGFCRSHYRRLRLYGDPLTPPRKVLRHQGTCSLATCERDARVRGLCRTHYTQNANRKRRAILFALGEHHTAEEWAAKLDEYGHKCAYCGTRAVERDHVVPLSKGGTDTIDNIVPACRSCNSMKSDRINWKGGVP